MANTNNNISSAAYATSLQQDIDAPSGYDVYSGADIKAVVHIPTDFLPIDKANEEQGTGQLNKTEYTSKPAVLGDIQTLSYSIYREKYPVRTIGMGYPKGFTRGPRTISGTMIFTMFNKQVLYDLMKRIAPDTSSDLSTPLIDQLPRFDITITFANEYGAASTLVIYGVEIISEGITMSIEDFFTENVVQYIAQDIRPMLPDTETMDRLQSENIGKTASQLLGEKRVTQLTIDAFKRL
jgi:hypothetical protein